MAQTLTRPQAETIIALLGEHCKIELAQPWFLRCVEVGFEEHEFIGFSESQGSMLSDGLPFYLDGATLGLRASGRLAEAPEVSVQQAFKLAAKRLELLAQEWEFISLAHVRTGRLGRPSGLAGRIAA